MLGARQLPPQLAHFHCPAPCAPIHCSARPIPRLRQALNRLTPQAASSAAAAEVQQELVEGLVKSTLGSRPVSDAQEAVSSNGAALAPVEPPSDEQHILLFYATGWQHPRLHYSIRGGAWQDTALRQVHSSGRQWSQVHLPLNGAVQSPSESPLLEFVLTEAGHDVWDKPTTGGNYTITEPGAFMLRDGEVQQSQGQPIMVVSDLDGTMIGDDAATAAFKQFWETEAVTRGSLLVYNTGRALNKFEELCGEKSGCLAMPDVLISSVGTKVYYWEDGNWAVDAEYASRLDQQWSLEAVRDATYAALAAVGKDSMHFRPPDEQNDHKVTCGVHCSVRDEVEAQITRALHPQQVAAQLIWSGEGDWRFLDIVSKNAGKLAALEFVRLKHGFQHSQTVACGDSGNDKDMLGGKNLAIVVGNAQPDLVAWVQSLKQVSTGQRQRLLTTQSHMALGILEGLQQFGLR